VVVGDVLVGGVRCLSCLSRPVSLFSLVSLSSLLLIEGEGAMQFLYSEVVAFLFLLLLMCACMGRNPVSLTLIAV